MYNRIAHVTLVVREYDEAIQFYTQKLDFVLLEDTKIDEFKQWVVIAPSGAKECCLLLAKAVNKEQLDCVGNQTGGRVGFFLFTDDFRRDYDKLMNRGVTFVRLPKKEPNGVVAVFQDLYGNLWDLLEPNEKNRVAII